MNIEFKPQFSFIKIPYLVFGVLVYVQGHPHLVSHSHIPNKELLETQ